MILLKAIGKTLLSILEIILIISLCLGGLIGALYITQFPNIMATIGMVLLGIVLVIFVFFIIFLIVTTTKENYEEYMRQSKNPINEYRIHYYKIYETCAFVESKTKKQAINYLYGKLAEQETDSSYMYKIKNIKKWN